MNADPRVMEFFVATMTPAETDALITRYREHWRTRGYGMCAVDRKLADGAHEFIGYIGLARVRYEIDFTPVVEVGWRLAPHVWGKVSPQKARRPRSRTASIRLASMKLSRSPPPRMCVHGA